MNFNRILRLEFLGNTLGLTEISAKKLRLAGYEDTNDAGIPATRQVVGARATKHTAASTGQMGRFETEVNGLRADVSSFVSLIFCS